MKPDVVDHISHINSVGSTNLSLMKVFLPFKMFTWQCHFSYKSQPTQNRINQIKNIFVVPVKIRNNLVKGAYEF